MEQSPIHVFVSYSRADQALISPIVKIIRAIGVQAFHDIDSIPSGKRWRPVIENSIEKADTILVFWCQHSQKSEEVRKEWMLAVREKKDVVPAFLDNTPLEPELAEYQGIDLRDLAANHSPEPSESFRLFPNLNDFPEFGRRKVKEFECKEPPRDNEDERLTLAANRVLEFLRKTKN